MKFPTHKGRLSISVVHGSHEGSHFSITLRDEVSGVPFFEATMSPVDFAMAMTGRAEQPCDFMIRWTHLIGMKCESKSEEVPVPRGGIYGERKTVAAAAVKPFEVDGWTARLSDIGNMHRMVKSSINGGEVDIFEVHFSRFVDPKTGVPVEGK